MRIWISLCSWEGHFQVTLCSWPSLPFGSPPFCLLYEKEVRHPQSSDLQTVELDQLVSLSFLFYGHPPWYATQKAFKNHSELSNRFIAAALHVTCRLQKSIQ